MKLIPKDRHSTVTRRGLFSPSSGRVVSEVMKPRAEMTLAERVSSDRRAVTRSMAAARTARVFADQQTQQFIQNPQPSKNPHDRLRLSRRTFLAASAATVATTKAFADTPFTSFAFPGTGRPTSRTMPARIADIFNVLDFGADPTGVADSQPAVLAATTAASNSGIIFFPKGNYKVLSAILIPSGSSLNFIGEGGSSFVQGTFNGFVFDNLSDPYNAAGGISSIEQLSISNGFVGNTFSVTANGTWSASGSPVNITLSGLNPGVAAGGALWVSGSGGLGTNSVFIGMITDVSLWPTVTVSSAAVGSGAVSNCAVHVIQCYAAGGSFSAAATTITMAATRPAGIGTGLYYVYDYELYLADPRTDFPIGVASWSGTTVTFTGTSNGALVNSIGASDRLWFAPVAGCIRYSSVVGAKVTNCFLSGFYGLDSSQDKINATDPSSGSSQAYHIEVDTCTFSNPSGFSGLMGQTGVYLTNNSIAKNSNSSGLWCAERLSGTACGIIGGRAEVNHFATIIGSDYRTSNGSLSNGFIIGRSMESNLQAIYCKNGTLSIISSGCSCFVSHQALGGFYLNAFSGVVQSSGATGNFGTSQHGIYIADASDSRGNITFISAFASNFSDTTKSWRIPAQAWWGTCVASDNPTLTYTYANLPDGTGSPSPIEGEEYNISNSNTAVWGATAAGGGSDKVKVRWNGTNWTVVGK